MSFMDNNNIPLRNKKKVLIIARDFIPYFPSLGGVLRAFKMAEYLQQQGMEVYVLAAKGVKIDYFGYGEQIKNLKIFYLPDPLQYRMTRIFNAENDITNRRQGNRYFAFIKKIINECAIPDKGRFLVSRYYRKALELIRDNDIRNVIVTSPPHSTQIIGLKLKKKLGEKINLIVDYRDSWNTTNIFTKKTRLTKHLSQNLEKEVLAYADHFTYVSPPILKSLEKKYFKISHKALLVMNGFDYTMTKSIVKKTISNCCLTIGYFGAISDDKSSYRNPIPFFNALTKINKRMKIVFYGAINISPKWKEKLEGIIEFYPNISHKDALARMCEMDVLLVIHTDPIGSDYVIPAKLFEYILAQRPVFVIGPQDMEAKRIVSSYGLGYTADVCNESDILNKLSSIYIDWDKNQLITYSIGDLYEFSRHYQNSKFIKILI